MDEIKMLAQVVADQRQFFATKATFPVAFRRQQLEQLKKMFKANEAALLKALQEDLGKHPTESYFTEIGLIYHSIDYALKHVAKWQKKKRKRTALFLQPASSYTLAAPYGNVLIMSAFNYPLLLSIDPLVGALAGGNTALIALSERTPAVNAVLLAQAPHYFSADNLYFYVSSVEKNSAVLKEQFAKIFFTGSTKVGQIVLEAASHHLTPVTLELGGKSPAVVTKHAKIALAAEKIAWGKFLNAGQTCVAPDYCLVDAQVAAEFQTALGAAIKKLYGEDVKQSADYPRLVAGPAFDNLTEMLERDQDFKIFGGAHDKEARYFEPTVVAAKLGTPLASMEAEIFGPILPVLTYETLAEAKAYMQAHPAPLAFYPFSEDKREVADLLGELQFGGATVNDTILHLANLHLPFGGVGNSGMGHYHGHYSFQTFTHEKAVLNRRTWLNLPIMRAPYTEKKRRLIKKFLP